MRKVLIHELTKDDPYRRLQFCENLRGNVQIIPNFKSRSLFATKLVKIGVDQLSYHPTRCPDLNPMDFFF